MNVFKFEGKELSVKKSEPLLKEWNRIMNGEPPGPKGGNQKKAAPERSLIHKSDR